MLQDFLAPFLAIVFAEIGDKTQLAMMALAAKSRHHLQIFLGAMTASVIVDGSAVLAGSLLAKYIPRTPVTIAAGIIFIAFGAITLLRKEKEEMPHLTSKKSALIAAFLLFFVSELGDKSQLAALLFGTQYNLLLALLGALAGIAVVLVIMLAAGKYISRHLNEKMVRTLSAVLFIGIGVLMLVNALLR